LQKLRKLRRNLEKQLKGPKEYP